MNTTEVIKNTMSLLGKALEEHEATPPNIADYGLGQECIIRTYAAGVFFGTPIAREGQELVLKDARRIWSWSGAFTLSAVSQNGIESGKLSCVEPTKLVLQVVEITPCAEHVAKELREVAAHDPS